MLAKKTIQESTATTIQAAQELPDIDSVHKLTSCGFKSKNEAMMAAGGAKKKGFSVKLIIEKGLYKLLFAEEISKETALEVLKSVEAAGLKAEIN